MIFDGHNVASEVDGDQFIYRPLRRGERERLWTEMSNMPTRIADRWEREIVESRIVVSEWACSIHELEDWKYRDIATLVLGVDNNEQEQADETNLADCVRLYEQYPWLRDVSCESCKAWMYDPLKGHVYQNNVTGELEAVQRPQGWPVPCESGACPKGHWTNPLELSPKNRLALQHYEETAGDGITGRTRRVIEDAKRSARANGQTDGGAG